MRMIAILLLFLGLVACKTTPPRDQTLGWQGSSATALVKQLGQPSVLIKSNSGNSIYMYSIRTSPRYPSAYGPAVGVNNAGSKPVLVTLAPGRLPTSTVSRCNMRFEVDQTNRIVNANSSGMDCFLFQKK